ncbi:unnamed protein product, partial [Iphiclides podalirius]
MPCESGVPGCSEFITMVSADVRRKARGGRRGITATTLSAALSLTGNRPLRGTFADCAHVGEKKTFSARRRSRDQLMARTLYCSRGQLGHGNPSFQSFNTSGCPN